MFRKKVLFLSVQEKDFSLQHLPGPPHQELHGPGLGGQGAALYGGQVEVICTQGRAAAQGAAVGAVHQGGGTVGGDGGAADAQHHLAAQVQAQLLPLSEGKQLELSLGDLVPPSGALLQGLLETALAS